MKANIMASYVSDELSNKVKCLHNALLDAQDIISKLQIENNRLQDALISLACLNNKDYILNNEAVDESVHTV